SSAAGRGGSRRRRGRDLNPRPTEPPATVFETAAFDRSATPVHGEGGIRTLEAGISPPNALAGRRLQPLGHFSWRAASYRSPRNAKARARRAFGEAEGEGFEPSTHLSARTRFPVALLRPLGHPSERRPS